MNKLNLATIATHTSIAAWAKEINSSAKTHTGQLRAIKNHVGKKAHFFLNLDITKKGTDVNQQYKIKEYRESQLSHNADRRAEVLGYTTTESQAWIEYCAAYSYNYAYNTYINDYINKSIDIISALKKSYVASWDRAHTYISIADKIVAVIAWTTDSNWDYYAKSYSRPKNTYSNRRVDFYNFIDGKIRIIYTIVLDDFRGEFLRRVLIQAAQALNLPTLCETVRNIPTRAQRIADDFKTPKICFKRVAVDGDKLVSIFDGKTEYKIGEVVSDVPQKCPDYDDICGYGGIFVHATREGAEKQGFPESSAAKNLSRVTLRGEYWGKTNINGKIAAEFFRPLEILK